MEITSHTVRVAIIITSPSPTICVVEQGGGRQSEQKNGSMFREKHRFGLPGGRKEKGDDGLIGTAVREVLEETGIYRFSRELLLEERSIHLEPTPSKRKGTDFFQEHFYLAILGEEPRRGEVKEKSEITGVYFFPLDSLPSPKDSVPFGYKHLTGLARLLRHCVSQVPEAEDWAKTVEMQIPSS